VRFNPQSGREIARHGQASQIAWTRDFEGLQSLVEAMLDVLYCFMCVVHLELEYGPMPNLMVALPNIGGALCSTPQSLADAHY